MSGKPTISVIIPTLNEAEQISSRITDVRDKGTAGQVGEIIVVDGGSSDHTVEKARRMGVLVVPSAKGRARQMNRGAEAAQGSVLYFLHADTAPPHRFDQAILDALGEGYPAGSFRHRFDDSHWLLRFTSWLVNTVPRIRLGDQSLFVERGIFERVGGFDEQLAIMEDADVVNRIKRIAPFTVVKHPVTTSARKFRENGVVRLFLIFSLIFLLYELHVPQKHLLGFYRGLIVQDKI